MGLVPVYILFIEAFFSFNFRKRLFVEVLRSEINKDWFGLIPLLSIIFVLIFLLVGITIHLWLFNICCRWLYYVSRTVKSFTSWNETTPSVTRDTQRTLRPSERYTYLIYFLYIFYFYMFFVIHKSPISIILELTGKRSIYFQL